MSSNIRSARFSELWPCALKRLSHWQFCRSHCQNRLCVSRRCAPLRCWLPRVRPSTGFLSPVGFVPVLLVAAAAEAATVRPNSHIHGTLLSSTKDARQLNRAPIEAEPTISYYRKRAKPDISSQMPSEVGILPATGKGSSDWSYAPIPVVGPLLGRALAGWLQIIPNANSLSRCCQRR